MRLSNQHNEIETDSSQEGREVTAYQGTVDRLYKAGEKRRENFSPSGLYII